jgi:hypothetical protein
MHKIKKPPAIETTPKILWNSDNFDNPNKVNRIIGRSVIMGATATLTPALISCCRVSEMTSVRSGPGAKPAESPRTIPIIK